MEEKDGQEIKGNEDGFIVETTEAPAPEEKPKEESQTTSDPTPDAEKTKEEVPNEGDKDSEPKSEPGEKSSDKEEEGASKDEKQKEDEGKGEGEGEEGSGESAPTKKKALSQAKRLKRKLDRKDEELARQEAELKVLRGQAGNKEQDKSSTDKPNDPDDFETYEDYLKAEVKRQVGLATASKAPAEDQSAVDAYEKMAGKYNARLEVFKDDHEDFDDLMEDVRDAEVEVPDHVGDFLMSAKDGPKLVYNLAKDIDTFEEICDMPKRAGIKKLKSFSESLKAEKSVKPAPKPDKKVSKAPKPMEATSTESKGGEDTEPFAAYEERANREFGY